MSHFLYDLWINELIAEIAFIQVTLKIEMQVLLAFSQMDYNSTIKFIKEKQQFFILQ